jgi:hypothetical protein
MELAKMINISDQARKQLENILAKENFNQGDLPDLIYSFGRTAGEVCELIASTTVSEWIPTINIVEEAIKKELEGLSTKEKISRLNEIISGPSKYGIGKATAEFTIQNVSREMIVDFAKSHLEPLQAESRIYIQVSRIMEPKNQFYELDKFIYGTKTIDGIDPNIVIKEAVKMKAALVEKYVNNNFSISNSKNMDDFVIRFVKGTSTLMGQSTNPEMKLIHISLKELQKLVKENKPEAAKLKVLHNLSDACNNFINNDQLKVDNGQPKNSMTDQVQALLHKLKLAAPAVEEVENDPDDVPQN